MPAQSDGSYVSRLQLAVHKSDFAALSLRPNAGQKRWPRRIGFIAGALDNVKLLHFSFGPIVLPRPTRPLLEGV